MMNPTRMYTAVTGIFLLLQGTSTLAFRLYSQLDEAFPQLLATTQMMPTHSILHIITGVLALVVLFRGGERAALWFSVGFGTFYTSLALYGYITHAATIFHLQMFDHPFHLLLGLLGLVAAGHYFYVHQKKESV